MSPSIDGRVVLNNGSEMPRLERLDLGTIDLYLVHWPVPGLRLNSWRAMEEIAESGRARAIGVSNYTVRHLRELLDNSSVVPAVNQVELSPFLAQRPLIDFCHRHGIRVVAYSPLTKGHRLGHPELGAIAVGQRRSPAQVLIRWALQHDLVVIPKSADRGHIRENAEVFDFELSARDMASLDGLDEGLRTSWDPTHEH